jgi:hypothetical protein
VGVGYTVTLLQDTLGALAVTAPSPSLPSSWTVRQSVSECAENRPPQVPTGLHMVEASTLQGTSPGFPSWRSAYFWGTLPA